MDQEAFSEVYKCEHEVSLGFAYCNLCGRRIYKVLKRRMPSIERRKFVQKVVEFYGMKCMYCCRQTIFAPPDSKKNLDHHFSVDHVVPSSLGGTTLIWNAVPCCYKCNRDKNNSNLTDWLQTKRVDYILQLLSTIYEEEHKDREHHQYE